MVNAVHYVQEITSLCKNGEFECTLGDCIQDASKCNGKFDCPDGEDEPFCIGKRRCRIDEFRYVCVQSTIYMDMYLYSVHFRVYIVRRGLGSQTLGSALPCYPSCF